MVGPMPPYSAGHYTSDPATLAQVNAGLPPDECASVIYIMSPWERWRAEYDQQRHYQLERLRAIARERV